MKRLGLHLQPNFVKSTETVSNGLLLDRRGSGTMTSCGMGGGGGVGAFVPGKIPKDIIPVDRNLYSPLR